MAAEFTVRIITELQHGYWSAWFADDPTCACGGEWPDQAIDRLLDAHPERAVNRDQIVALEDAERDDHREFLAPLQPSGRRPDCGGSGIYVGLREVELCGTCHGNGYLAS